MTIADEQRSKNTSKCKISQRKLAPPGKKCQRPCQKNSNETCAEPSCNCRHPPECQEIQERKEAAVMARSVLYPHEEKSEPPEKRSKKKDGKNWKRLSCHGAERQEDRWCISGYLIPCSEKVQWRSRLKKKRKDPRGSDLRLR